MFDLKEISDLIYRKLSIRVGVTLHYTTEGERYVLKKDVLPHPYHNNLHKSIYQLNNEINKLHLEKFFNDNDIPYALGDNPKYMFVFYLAPKDMEFLIGLLLIK